jgi:hypothetical protein
LISENRGAEEQNLQKLDRGLISKKHRGFFAKFLEILINELFPNSKGRGPGAEARRRAHRSMAYGRSGAPKLTGGGATERERSTGSSVRASPELGRRCGGRATVVQNRRRRRLVRGRLERGEKRREAGRGAVNSEGGARLL